MKKEKTKNLGISIKTIGWAAFFLSIIISGLLVLSLFLLSNKFSEVQKSTNDYMNWKSTALEVREASDYLTDQARYYVINKHKIYMDNYFEEADVTKRRDHALEVMNQYLPDTKAREGIEQAVTRSRYLMLDEFYAMRLIVESLGITMDDTYPIEVKETFLKQEDINKTPEEKVDLAFIYVFGDKYLEDKEFITTKVNYAISEIDTLMEKNVISSTDALKKILILQQILVGLNIAGLAFAIFVIFFYVGRPIKASIEKIQNHDYIELKGFREIKILGKTYNEVRAQSENVKEKLRYEAEHDQLTSLYNRTGYDAIYRTMKLERCYYILIDVDFFKKVNDSYGHETGDKVLMKVAKILNEVFSKDNEYAFRLGGDEFAVLVEHNNNMSIEDIKEKCELLTNKINEKGSNTPKITLSIGIAKGEKTDSTDTLFKKADNALYTAKNNGRHNISVYTK